MGIAAPAGNGAEVVVNRADGLQFGPNGPYWFTRIEVQQICRIGRTSFFNLLGKTPRTERVKVTRRVGGYRTTRYWRVSPTALKIIGHLSGQAPYL